MVQRLGTGAGCAGGLRGRQAGPLPGRLGGRPGLGESPHQRGRRGEGRGRGHLDLPRGADGGVALRVAEAVRGRGAGRSGRQADRRRLTRRLVGHGSRLAVRDFGGDGGQLLCCKETRGKYRSPINQFYTDGRAIQRTPTRSEEPLRGRMKLQ